MIEETNDHLESNGGGRAAQTEPLAGDLVAYLDGELDETRSREIEATLVESQDVRAEVDRLQRSFDLLDLLPLAKASPEFSERTLSTIAVEARETTRPVWGERLRRGATWGAWGLGLAVVGLVAFSLTHRWVETDADLLVRDLPVVENLDVYAEIGSVDFVVLLRDSDLLPDPEQEERDERPSP